MFNVKTMVIPIRQHLIDRSLSPLLRCCALYLDKQERNHGNKNARRHRHSSNKVKEKKTKKENQERVSTGYDLKEKKGEPQGEKTKAKTYHHVEASVPWKKTVRGLSTIANASESNAAHKCTVRE